MKAQSTIRPERFKIIDLGIKKELVLCENINEITNEENEILYAYDMTMQTVGSHSNVIADLIHLKYTYDDELSLLNKGLLDSQNQSYITYRDYVNDVKLFIESV